jgi:hypothetical protein
MADLLQTGAAWLAGQLKAHASQAVTYRRGGFDVSLQATLGRTAFQQTDEHGQITTFHSHDFLVSAADLVIYSKQSLPEPGDQVLQTVGSEVLTFEVLPMPDGEHYRFCDPFRQQLRIHTKQIA